MDLAKYVSEIHKTGFVLENRVAIQLKQAGWTVISNKYYEDDHTNTVREIDLLAYKATQCKHFKVYTSLIVSCKKSADNSWVLLARDINLNEPNSDWWPLHTWSNDKSLLYELNQPNGAKAYHKALAALGVTEALAEPEVEVFAYQEMSSTDGKPKNDTNIFTAVTSLMKAQAYELSALPHRKKTPAIYQFNLISINDSDLVRLKFTDEKIGAEQIESEHYIARYIIKKVETFSRIRFIKASHFKNALHDYDRLHLANCNWFEKTCDQFFDGIVTDRKRRILYLEEFRKRIGWYLIDKIQDNFKETIELKDISLDWIDKENLLAITFPANDIILEALTADAALNKFAAKALKEIYRYSGKFIYSDGWDIPF